MLYHHVFCWRPMRSGGHGVYMIGTECKSQTLPYHCIAYLPSHYSEMHNKSPCHYTHCNFVTQGGKLNKDTVESQNIFVEYQWFHCFMKWCSVAVIKHRVSKQLKTSKSSFELVAPGEEFLGLRKTWQQVKSMMRAQKDKKSHLQAQTQSRKRELGMGQGHKFSDSASMTDFFQQAVFHKQGHQLGAKCLNTGLYGTHNYWYQSIQRTQLHILPLSKILIYCLYFNSQIQTQYFKIFIINFDIFAIPFLFLPFFLLFFF